MNVIVLLSLAVILGVSIYSSYEIEQGPIVPTTLSTQNQYCSNGICSTPNNKVNLTAINEMRSKYPIIFIIPSEACVNAIKHHVLSACPPLQNLTKYDTSNQNISGYFYTVDGKTLERTKPQVKNHWQYYSFLNKTIVCVYCSGNFINPDLFQEIIIEPHGFTFIHKEEAFANKTWNSYNDRNMQGCDTATIAYSDSLLQDTINFLRSGCVTTNFNNTTVHKVNNGVWEWNNPYSTLHQDSYLKSIMKGHTYDYGNKTSGGRGIGDCIRHTCSFTDPYKKW